MFNISTKYFSFFNNKPPENWVAIFLHAIPVCITSMIVSCKFCISANNKKVDSIKTGGIIIAHFLLWSDQKKSLYAMNAFLSAGD